MKYQTKALYRLLSAEQLDFGDLVTISHACIKMRDAMFQAAEEARERNELTKAQQLERLGAQYNRVLLRVRHPAAIEGKEGEKQEA